MDTAILARVEDFCIREGLLQPGAPQHLAAAVSGGADSMALLERVVVMAEDIGYVLGNADITIVAQAPKLAPYIEQMRENISTVCGTDISDVNVKATTTEGLGFEGQGQGISAHAVVLLYKNEEFLPGEV